MQPRRAIPIFCSCYALLALAGCRTEAPQRPAAALVTQDTTPAIGDSIALRAPYFAQAGDRGKLFFADQNRSELVIVADSSGKFERTLGRKGKGPGEFARPTFVLPKGDSVIVGDVDGRVSLFASNGQYVRSLPILIPNAPIVLRLRGDTLLVAQPGRTPEDFGLPLHLVPPDGTPAHSFGADDRSVDPARQFAQWRWVANESDSTFWVARADRYTIERWNSRAQRETTFTLTRKWFPPMQRSAGTEGVERPSTRLMGVHQDRHGHLVVLLERARSDWAPNAAAEAASKSQKESSTQYLPTHHMQYVEQVIEILDSRTTALLGSVVNDSKYLIMQFLDDDRLFGLREGKDGRQLPILWRLDHAP